MFYVLDMLAVAAVSISGAGIALLWSQYGDFDSVAVFYGTVSMGRVGGVSLQGGCLSQGYSQTENFNLICVEMKNLFTPDIASGSDVLIQGFN